MNIYKKNKKNFMVSFKLLELAHSHNLSWNQEGAWNTSNGYTFNIKNNEIGVFVICIFSETRNFNKESFNLNFKSSFHLSSFKEDKIVLIYTDYVKDNIKLFFDSINSITSYLEQNSIIPINKNLSSLTKIKDSDMQRFKKIKAGSQLWTLLVLLLSSAFIYLNFIRGPIFKDYESLFFYKSLLVSSLISILFLYLVMFFCKRAENILWYSFSGNTLSGFDLTVLLKRRFFVFLIVWNFFLILTLKFPG